MEESLASADEPGGEPYGALLLLRGDVGIGRGREIAFGESGAAAAGGGRVGGMAGGCGTCNTGALEEARPLMASLARGGGAGDEEEESIIAGKGGVLDEGISLFDELRELADRPPPERVDTVMEFVDPSFDVGLRLTARGLTGERLGALGSLG